MPPAPITASWTWSLGEYRRRARSIRRAGTSMREGLAPIARALAASPPMKDRRDVEDFPVMASTTYVRVLGGSKATKAKLLWPRPWGNRVLPAGVGVADGDVLFRHPSDEGPRGTGTEEECGGIRSGR